MKNEYYRVYAQIDFDAIEYNIEQMQKNLLPGTKMLAVIKSDGYGHGAIPVAKELETNDNIYGYAVANLEEAVSLRQHGIRKMILILGYSFPEQYETLVAYDISPSVYRLDMARALSEEGMRQKKQVNIHLKLDTGMRRIGLLPDEEGLKEAKEILSLPNLHSQGVFTHFAKSDETDKTAANQQIRLFEAFVKQLEEAGFAFDFKHCCNSAGIIDLQYANMDMVRAGIAFYGVYPSDEVNKQAVDLRPALSLKSTIVHIKTVPAGMEVSYGGTYTTTKETTIATIPVGYGDGYPRLLSGKGYVLIRGQKAPILGRVCMDQFMVDVTHIHGVAMRDTVTLIGKDGKEEITVDELGTLSGRFSYEFLCDLGKRIPRIYSKEGKLSEKKDCFEIQ